MASCAARLPAVARLGCTPRLCQSVRPGPLARPLSVRVHAKKDDDQVSGLMSTASSLIDKAADMVPESVPRGTARTGVTVAGALVGFWLVQKVLSGVLTVAIFAGIGYFFLTSSGKESGSSNNRDDDMDDPLSEAKKIMNKYK